MLYVGHTRSIGPRLFHESVDMHSRSTKGAGDVAPKIRQSVFNTLRRTRVPYTVSERSRCRFTLPSAPPMSNPKARLASAVWYPVLAYLPRQGLNVELRGRSCVTVSRLGCGLLLTPVVSSDLSSRNGIGVAMHHDKQRTATEHHAQACVIVLP